MIIKVCGTNRPENIRVLSTLDFTWIGFIFWEGSVRAVTPECEGVDTPWQKRVGVFVDATISEMARKVAVYNLQYLQLHGNESPGVCRKLKKYGFSVIKAFHISSEDDIKQTALYEGLVDYFLFDTRCDTYGGSGQSFDWSILQAYQGSTPFLLSGGINPSSLDEIKAFQHPMFTGIDLNSGFEREPGIKDYRKLQQFIDSLNQ